MPAAVIWSRPRKPAAVRQQPRCFREDRALALFAVDEDRGVIRSALILGPRSSNGRVYTPECLADAVRRGLYEGVPIYGDHRANQERSVEDMIGKVYHARLATEGIRADLHLVKGKPLAEQLLADAADRSGIYALSHHAHCQEADCTEGADGVLTVRRMEAISSVDVVSRPASTSNLWETAMPRLSKSPRYALSSYLEDLRSRPASDFPREQARSAARAPARRLTEDKQAGPLPATWKEFRELLSR